MKLYEVARELELCVKIPDSDDVVNAETGELVDTEALDALKMEYEKKVEGIGRWVKNLKAEDDAIRAEEKNLAARRRANENKIESLMKYLEFCTNGQGFDSPTVKISYRSSTSVDVNMEQFMTFEGYDDYVKYAEPTADKTAIKKALKDGIELPGCSLVTKNNIQIK